MTNQPKRTTLYAAFLGTTPMINVWDWNKRRLEVLMSDRLANGEASPDERLVRVTVAYYDRLLAAAGLPGRDGRPAPIADHCESCGLMMALGALASHTCGVELSLCSIHNRYCEDQDGRSSGFACND